MKRIVNLLLLVFLLISNLYAQEDFIRAKYLFDNAQYSAAQSVLNQISGVAVTAEVMYLDARCSKELFMDDAILLYEKLNSTFPYNEFKEAANEDMAIIYYREKQYSHAISFFIKIKELSVKNMFKLAYSNFSIDSLEQAQLYFSRVMSMDSKLSSPAKYYYAYIAYQNGLYNSALENFQSLLDDDKFGEIVPYYICQIHLYQENYQQLISFALPLLDNVISTREDEIKRLLAEAYYRQGDFSNAIHYLEKLIINKKTTDPMLRFMLGHSYYKQKEYEYAVLHLENVIGITDSVMQYSSYYLGASYLNVGYYDYALHAFKKSASFEYNRLLQEDAYFNYAKLSYQLDLPFENTLNILTAYLDAFGYSDNVDYIKHLMIDIFESTSRYSEAYMALESLDSLSMDQQKSLQRVAFFLGIQQFNRQDFEEAISYFIHANQYAIDPLYSYLSNFWLSDCYFHLSDYDKAIDSYLILSAPSKELKVFDDLRKYNLAYSYFKNRDYVSSIRWFRSYLKVSVDSMKIHDTYLRLGDGYFMSRNFSLSANYYEKAILSALFDNDYALYQNSVVSALIGDDFRKLSSLNQIISNYHNSTYYFASVYDLAKYYKNISEYDLANKYYDILIDSAANDDWIADAYLSKGIIHLNSGSTQEAINQFLIVINNYQKTKYFKQALSSLEFAYSSIAKIEEYIAVVESLPGFSITRAEQDSLTYNTAFIKFLEMDYLVAKGAFEKYLDSFEDGIFIDEAIYYNAVSSLEIGDTLSAISYYEKVFIGSLPSSFKENALIFLSRFYYDISDYEQSNRCYSALLSFVSSNSIKREAITRLMIGYDQINSLEALIYAQQVTEFERLDDWLLSRAYIILARNEFVSGNYAKSRNTFNKVANLSVDDEEAEAIYYLAYLSYLDDSLSLSEQLIFKLARNYNNDRFIAEGFLLLSDIYLEQDKLFQAKATLESVIENYDGEDIIEIARKKWELIVESETDIVVDEFVDQAFIEILEDDFEYEVDEIDFNYVVPLPDSLDVINKNILENEIE